MTGLIISVGYMFRYSRAVRRMCELIDQTPGGIRAFLARYNCAYSQIDKKEWWDIRFISATVLVGRRAAPWPCCLPGGLTMLRPILMLIVITGLTSTASAEPLGVIYSQDFEKAPLGADVRGLVRDNTWTGNKTGYRVVDTEALGGRALEVTVNTFAQFVLAEPVKVVKGRYYRISGTVASLGAKKFSVILRQGPPPYTAYVSVAENAAEQWKRFDYTIKCGHDAADAGVFVVVNGEGPFWLGELRIEETAEPPARQEVPLAGNMVQNSSFELGWDGWASRDESAYAPGRVPGRATLDEGQAHSGRQSIKLQGYVYLSCPFHPVAIGQQYTVSAWARADFPADVTLCLFGTNYASRTFKLKPGEWTAIEFTHQFAAPVGSAVAQPYASVRVAVSTPPDKGVWVDDISLRAGKSAPYEPRATSELSVGTDRPANLIVAGDKVTLRVRCARHVADGQQPQTAPEVGLEMKDENEQTVRTWPAIRLSTTQPAANGFVCYSAELPGESLAPGFWRLVTRSGRSPQIEGEALINCVPPLPAETPFSWELGTHNCLSPLPLAGVRWSRLHDACIATKWQFLEPTKGNWQWAKADEQVKRHLDGGFRVLGLLDGVPAWRSKDGKPSNRALSYPDHDLADWGNYVQQVVTHFKGRIDHWEVVNEAIFSGQGPGGLSNEQWYVELLKVAYRQAKQANPDCVVIAGGGAGAPVKDNGWWRGAIAAGILAHCDAVSYHGYGYAAEQVLAGPQPLLDYMQWIREQMQKATGRMLPVWDTEVGFSPQTVSLKYWWPQRGPDTPMAAARKAVVCMLAEKAAGVAKTFYYHAFALRLFENGELMMFADINDQLQPAATALAVAMSRVHGLEPAGVEQPAPGTTVLCFRTPKGAPEPRTVWAAWTRTGVQQVTLKAPIRAKVAAIDFLGRPAACRHQEENTIIEAGPLPMYVTAE